jgi:phage gp29-like protein
LRALGKDIDAYEDLLSDSRVKGCFNSRRAGVLSLDWELEQNGAQARAYKTIKSCFDSWPIKDILAELLNAVFFGYQPMEIVWKKVGGLLLPEKVVTKPARWFRYSDLNELRFLTKRNMVTGEPVPEYKFIVARYHPSYANPYGEALGSAVYWPVRFKRAGLRFYTTFLEKYAMPWVTLQYPVGTQQQRVMEMISILNQTMQDGIIAFPAEWKAESLNMSEQSASDNYETYLNRMDTEIAIALLGQNLTTEVKGGSYAAAGVHNTVRKDLIDEDIRICEGALQTVIDWVYALNFTDENIPKFKLIQTPAPTKDEADMAVAMTRAGVRLKEAYWSSRFNLLDNEFSIASPEEIAAGLQSKTEPIAGEPTSPGEEELSQSTDKKIAGELHQAGDQARNDSTWKSVAATRGKAY